jgi:adenosylcobinamide kinase/adenosylcobinamide-phosphate guanylyltransferase
MRELILGGARSGKSRAAEARAAAWLTYPDREACVVATATASDAEMRARIAHHRRGRAQRVPALTTLEEPLALPDVIRAHTAPHRLLLVDCLTLWLTNLLMPTHGPGLDDDAWAVREQAFIEVLQGARGPVVVVSNEIGLGFVPMAPEVRRFGDALGRLHQCVAEVCERVTWMLAGIEVPVKGTRV